MTTTITAAAFAYLDPSGDERPRCDPQTLDPTLAGYLDQHLLMLADKADRDTAPPAEFQTDGSQAAFRELASAPPDRFAEPARRIACQLRGTMDGRTAPGLCVVVQRNGGTGPRAAVLKLEVVEEQAGTLIDAGGRAALEIVRNVVDQPGALQKGAAYPDPRSDSHVIVGDKLGGAASQYFLAALAIQQIAHPREATKRLIRKVQEIRPASAGPVASKLATASEDTVERFLATVPPSVLPESDRDRIVEELARDAPHPAKRIAPGTARLKRTLEADGVTISGRLADMERVKVTSKPGGTWRAEIQFDHEPEERYG